MHVYNNNDIIQETILILTNFLFLFIFIQSLKFWRSRFLLLPSHTANIKKLMDETNEYCDIFSEQTAEETGTLIEGLLRVVETLNRIRRPIAAIRRAKVRVWL